MAITINETDLLTSVNGSSVASSTIILVNRLTSFQSSGNCCQNFCIKVDGVNGLTPTFRANTTQSYQGGFSPAATERFFWSYDKITWTAFDQASVSGSGYYEVTNTFPFNQNTVWFSRDRREGVAAISDWLTAFDVAHSSQIAFLAGKSAYDLFTYSAQTNELGATIAGQKVYGFKLTDPSLGNASTKRNAVVTSAVHASECIGTTVHKAICDAWVGGTSQAIALRTAFNLVNIMGWNMMGVEGGHVRAQFDPLFGANDANRNMNIFPSPFEEVGLPRQVLMDNLVIGRTPFSLDMHGSFNDGTQVGYFLGGSGFAPLNGTFGTTLNSYTSAGSFGTTVPSDYANGFIDAFCGVTFGCPVAETIEVNMKNYALLTDAKVVEYGTGIVKALGDMQIAGLFGSGGASGAPFNRRSA